VVAVDAAGKLLMYRGTGAGAFVPGGGLAIGTGWGGFTALLAPGDGRPDLLARTRTGCCCSTAATGAAASDGEREQIGTGWQSMTALVAPSDWNGDGHLDILAPTSDGKLLMYRGNGAGGFVTGQRELIGGGWSSLGALTLVWDPPARPPPPRPLRPPPRSPRAAPSSGSRRAARVPAGASRSASASAAARAASLRACSSSSSRASAAPSASTTGGRSSCGCG
jgi:hypothetical protein